MTTNRTSATATAGTRTMPIEGIAAVPPARLSPSPGPVAACRPMAHGAGEVVDQAVARVSATAVSG